MTQFILDEKHRVTLPRELRRSLGTTSGSRLEAEQRGGELVIKPAVPVKSPMQAIWGLASTIKVKTPKRDQENLRIVEPK